MSGEQRPLGDIDSVETQEWLESIASVIEREGHQRAHELLQCVTQHARLLGMQTEPSITTPYINTIPVGVQAQLPGDLGVATRASNLIRWNSVAMVVQAGKVSSELGGHLATYMSSAVLYDMAFDHFLKGKNECCLGDLLFIQGHGSPGLYARALMEGRLSVAQCMRFRQECFEDGLSSYPHPWLMPKFWQFPTVSMGLGALQAIYQAKFMQYLENRSLIPAQDRKVWLFAGDGEMDEPESLGALNQASREKLGNLIFVVNCNLQRLDGPVHGNGKIVQELEGVYRGAGWHVIKVLWDSHMDKLFAADVHGHLRERLLQLCDGEFQSLHVKGAQAVREVVFGASPELKAMGESLSDEDMQCLGRGGHDPRKVYAAYAQAMEIKNQPVVVLVKTVKGHLLPGIEGQNSAHQDKKMKPEALIELAKRLGVPLSEEQAGNAELFRPSEDSPEVQFLQGRRKELGGYLPARDYTEQALPVPKLDAFQALLEDSGERTISTTMAFVRCISVLLKDPELSKLVIPIVPDEARTFGMEGLFRQIGIYASGGQQYEPVDRKQVMYYREAKDGQFMQEGLSEGGAFSTWMAAATSYSVHDLPLIPFYVYYSMFGFQRIGDLAWAAGDMRSRGFLLGATAGRTTLAGEGLQHQDGHSHVLCSTIPNCISYDPTYAYEVAVIIRHGIQRMMHDHDDVYFYLSVCNENYHHRAMPKGCEDGIIKGLYKLETDQKAQVQLIGCGTILKEVERAAQMLKDEFGIASNVWSAPSFNELRRDIESVQRYSLMNPKAQPKETFVRKCFKDQTGPVIAATDYMRIFCEPLRAEIDQDYVVLGTDGFGRSDTRKALRRFFEVDAEHIVYAALCALHRQGHVALKQINDAVKRYQIEQDQPDRTQI